MNRAPLAKQLPPTYALRAATCRHDYESFARLVLDYHAWLKVDLCFQNFEQELASLPGCYAPPAGCILLVSYADDCTGSPQDIACVAVRPLKQLPGDISCSSAAGSTAVGTPIDLLAEVHTHLAHNSQRVAQLQQQHTGPSDCQGGSSCDTCELKRLWVAPAHQQCGAGYVLMQAALQAAKRMGYKRMVLDTLQTLTAANRLYDHLGFVRTDPYYQNPLQDVVYLQKEL